MSRKDYVAIAAAFKQQVGDWPANGTHWHSLKAVAEAVADAMKQDNSRFDRARFLAACGF